MGTGLAALGAGLFALGGILRTNRIFRLVLFFLLSLLLSLRRGGRGLVVPGCERDVVVGASLIGGDGHRAGKCHADNQGQAND